MAARETVVIDVRRRLLKSDVGRTCARSIAIVFFLPLSLKKISFALSVRKNIVFFSPRQSTSTATTPRGFRVNSDSSPPQFVSQISIWRCRISRNRSCKQIFVTVAQCGVCMCACVYTRNRHQICDSTFFIFFHFFLF